MPDMKHKSITPMVKFRYSGSKLSLMQRVALCYIALTTKLTIVTLLRPDVNICFGRCMQ